MPFLKPWDDFYSFTHGTDITAPTKEFDDSFFSFADEIETRLAIKQQQSLPMTKLKKFIDESKKFVKKYNQDLVFVISGGEGSGKSTLALQMAYLLDPEFDLDTQMINSFIGKHSFADFLKKYRYVPYKVVFFDEAVSLASSGDHPTKDSKNFIKIYNKNRDFNHFHLFLIPSFWNLNKDLRERRLRCMVYTYGIPHRLNGKIAMNFKYALYSRKRTPKILGSNDARNKFLSPTEFIKIVKPNFIESFPPLDPQLEKLYLKRKRHASDDDVGEIILSSEIKKLHDIKELTRDKEELKQLKSEGKQDGFI